MRNGDTHNRSAAVPVEKHERTNAPTNYDERGAHSIRSALEILRDLLLRDDTAQENLLLGDVREAIDDLTIELGNLAGRQELFEMWIRNV